QSYRLFSWPQSMQAGALPWEASRAVLDLLRLRSSQHMEVPLVAEAQWFWRVTQAIPDAPIEQRARAALLLVATEMGQSTPAKNLEVLQWRLVYQPWRSPKDKHAYLRAAGERGFPITYSDSQSKELSEDMIQLLGHHFRLPGAEMWTFGSVFPAA